MPIYEYVCDLCDSSFEVLQPVGAPRSGECSQCGGPVERVPSRASTNFGRHSSPTAEKQSRLSVGRQAAREAEFLVEHSKRTGVALGDLFEDHEHH